MVNPINYKSTINRKRIVNTISTVNVLKNVYNYGFWLVIVIFISIVNFPDLKPDLFHLILSIAIIWILIGLFYLKKVAKFSANYNMLDRHNLKMKLQNIFPKSYIKVYNTKTIIIEDHSKFIWNRRITVLLEKENLYVNIMSLGRFDIPSPFHSITNFTKAKKLAFIINELAKS